MKFFFIRLLGLIALSVGFCSLVRAQAEHPELQQWQDSLFSLEQQLNQPITDAERIEKNFTFVKTLVSALQERNSFSFLFPRLKHISILEAPDKRFRIFSWQIPLGDGTHLYYGAIQHARADGSLALTPLFDRTVEIQEPDSQLLTPKKWYGAQYYQVIAFGDAYLLLGWKGHSRQQSQKVIEPIHIGPEGVTFGGRIFGDQPSLKRRIFRYASQVSMYLRYDAPLKRIVFDHLVPAEAQDLKVWESYGPDLSFDAYRIVGKTLKLEEDISFQNNEILPEESTAPGQAIPGKSSRIQ